MDDRELMVLAEQIRRGTTQRSIVDLCDGVLRLLARARSSTVEQAPYKRQVEGSNPSGPTKFNKVAYQREYMRRYRARKISKK